MELTTHESFSSTGVSESFILDTDALTKTIDVLIYTCIIASLLTVIINPLTILAMAMHGMLKKTAANLFIASLCFADFIVGLSTFLLKVQELLMRSSNQTALIAIISWSASALTGIGFYSSLFTAFIIGLDRAIATITPTKYRSRITHKRGILALILLWICASCLILVPIFTKRLSYGKGQSLPIVTQARMAYPLAFIQYFSTPMIMICLFGNALLYVAIVTAFNKVAKKNSSTEKRSNRLTRMSIIVVSTLLLGNFPIAIASIFPDPADRIQELRAQMIFNVLTIFMVIPTFANNFIYAWHQSEFRKAYWGLFRCRRHTGVHPGQSTTAQTRTGVSTTAHHAEE